MESNNLSKSSKQKFLNIFKVLKQINGDVDVNANIRNQTEFKNAIHSIAASSTELVKQYDQQNALKNQTQSAKQNMLKVLRHKLSKKSQKEFEELLADPNFDKDMFSSFSKDVQQKNFVSYLYNNMGEGFLLLYYMTMKDYKQSIISVQRIGPC